MAATPIDRAYEEYNALMSYLAEHEETSFRVIADANFKKSLLLAAASYFEKRITDDLQEYVRTCTNSSVVFSLVKKKALERQYHTLFDWKVKNVNQFWTLLGDEFKKYMEAQVKTDPLLEQAIVEFMNIGSDRNRLVHNDYVNYVLDKTTSEIYDSYKKAIYFVDTLSEKLRVFKDMPR